MSIYSDGSVKTKLLEPSTYNENVSAEFRITEPCLPSLRLIDVGCKNNQNVPYNKLLGAYGVIKSVFLYSGQMLLDGCPNIAHYMAFRRYNRTNSQNKALSKFLARNQLGFGLTSAGVGTDAPAQNNQSGQTDAVTTEALVPLVEYLPILEKLNVLDPAVFKNLRLVIEFESDPSAILDVSNSTSINTRRPRLIMDCLMGSYNANPAMVSWSAIEQDRFTVAALGNAAASPNVVTNAKLNGFNSKLVGRILMVKAPAVVADVQANNGQDGFGRYASIALLDEKIQVTLNGGALLPLGGVDGAGNKMLSMLNDTWGTCNTLPGGNCGQGITTVALYTTQLQEYQGQQSYFGMFLNERVKDLQISLTRTGLFDQSGNVMKPNIALNCLLYGEVSKSLVIKGGEVNVIYN